MPGFLHASRLVNGFGFASLLCGRREPNYTRLSPGNEAWNFCKNSLGEELLPPAGKELNCSDDSKPGWSSHWGSVLGFNVSEECALSGILKKDWQKGGGSLKYSTSETFTRQYIHIFNVTWSPAGGPGSFYGLCIWSGRLVEVGIRAHSGKYTAEPALQLLAQHA